MNTTYLKYKEAGLCIKCGKDPIHGQRLCQRCKDRNYQNKCIRMEKETADETLERKQREHLRSKKRFEERKKNGICGDCGKNPAIEGFTICQQCQDEDKEEYQWFKSHGICTYCHKEQTPDGKILCDLCFEKQRIREAERKSDPIIRRQRSITKEKRRIKRWDYYRKHFICTRCGKDLTDNDKEERFVNCLSCRKAATHRAKLYQKLKNPDILPKETRKSLGLCVYCGNKVKKGETKKKGKPFKVCEECYNNLPCVIRMNG